jgi:hypothetical protein
VKITLVSPPAGKWEVMADPGEARIFSPKAKRVRQEQDPEPIPTYIAMKDWIASDGTAVNPSNRQQQPQQQQPVASTSGTISHSHAMELTAEISRLKREIKSRDSRDVCNEAAYIELKDENLQLKKEIQESKNRLSEDVIRATMRAVSGTKSKDFCVQTMPHDMSATYRRCFDYGMPWQHLANCRVHWIDGEQLEAERIANHPEDPAIIKLSGWLRSYDNRPGDLTLPSLTSTTPVRATPPTTRGAARGRGGLRGGTTRPYRGRRYR